MNGGPGGRPSHGALVISLDFELHWGVRERHSSQGAYACNLYGARRVIPCLLDLFEEFGVAATWAAVGFLFATSREELEEFSPHPRPGYRNPTLSSYEEPVGANEDDDPLHFAPSLIRRIRCTPRQEIATHTFSHYYCGEEGQTGEAFRADLAAACAIAARNGIRLRSIVFPRNQHNPAYDDILCECGIRAYRGTPGTPIWRFANAEEGTSPWKRVGRALDAYVGITGDGTLAWSDVQQSSGLSDVRGSCFLRPYRPALRYLELARFRRIRDCLRLAAQAGRIFHLWWHPHNFGVYQDENLAFLRRVLAEFAAYREEYGMKSLSMAEVDDCARTYGQSHAARTYHTNHAPPPLIS